MPKAAIYARFSTDLQNDRSIEDQLALCRLYASRNGYDVVEVYSDRAMSGASMLGRDGLYDLMADARAQKFDAVIVEALDRLSRDQEDLPHLYKRLTHLGVTIMAVHDGKADAIQVGIRGLVSTLFLGDLKHKIRRGLAGVTRDGRVAGGLCYGYRLVPGKPGAREIVEEQAEVIRRIFAAFAAGANSMAICTGLNAEGIMPPRGQAWMPSALEGNKKRGNGILLNPVYGGELVWNRVTMVKDPDTGKRVSRVNPPEAWQRQPVPELAIVDPKTFAAVQQRLAGRATVGRARRRMPKRVLSGLLKCACCGGGLSIKDRDLGKLRVVCTRAREGSACSNRSVYLLEPIEQTVLAGLQNRFGSREAVAIYLAEYNAERAALAGAATRQRGAIERKLASVTREIDRTLDLLIKGLMSEADGWNKLPPLRVQKAELEADLAAIDAPPKVIALHPTAATRYIDAVAKLNDRLAQSPGDIASASHLVRELIDHVTVHPRDEAGNIRIDVSGRLDQIFDDMGTRLFPSSSTKIRSGGKMVAGERYRVTPRSDIGVFHFTRTVGRR